MPEPFLGFRTFVISNSRDILRQCWHHFQSKRDLLRFTLETSLEQRGEPRTGHEALSPNAALRQTMLGALPLDEQARAHWLVAVAFCSHTGEDTELTRIQRYVYRDFRANVTELVSAARHTAQAARRLEASA